MGGARLGGCGLRYVVENTMMEVGGVRNEINRYVTWYDADISLRRAR